MKGFKRRHLLKGSLLGVASGTIALPGLVHAAEEKAPPVNKEYDVIIVGCGTAGLAAAIEAADKGAKVAIFEKMGRPAGNTLYAGGVFNATDTYVQKQQGLQDTVDQFYKDMMTVSEQRADPGLTRQYCELSGSAIQWLTDRCGIKWKPIVVEVFPGLMRGHVVDGPLLPGGSQLLKQLQDTAKAANIPIFFNTKVISLIGDNRLHVLGVRTLNRQDEPMDYLAKGGVIICTGGFHANKEMLTKYMGGDACWMPIRGSHYLQGENVLLTWPFTPQYVNMDQFHAGPIHGPTGANPSTLVNYGIIVKPDGTRFIDEASTYVTVAQRMPFLTPDNWAYIIIDDQVSEIPTVKTRLERYKAQKAPIFEGQTIAEAAKAAGLPEKVLTDVVTEYNYAVSQHKADELAPPNTLEKPRLIEKPPFRILPFQGGITATFGGPKISKKSEVLNMDNRPIPGLYAAGNAIGGLFYHDYIVGSQLCAAVIYGRIAADEAAARALKA